MVRQLLFLVAAFSLGVGATLFWSNPAQPVRATVQVEPIKSRTFAAQPAAPKERATRTFTFAELAELTGDFEQTVALYRLMDGQDAPGIEALLDQAQRFLRGADLAAASALLYGRLAELAPKVALRRVLDSPGIAQRSWLHAVFHAWARIDFDTALAEAKALRSPQRQIAARALLLSKDALSSVERQGIAADFGVVVPALSSGDDFAGAWQQALGYDRPGLKMRNLHSIASAWASVDPAAAMQAVEQVSGHAARGLQMMVVHQWAQKDPGAALDWVFAQPKSTQNNQLVQQVFQQLAQLDLADAQQRAEQLSGDRQTRAMLGLMAPLAAADPDAASQWLLTQKSRQIRTRALQSIAASLATEAPDEIDSWLETLPSEEAMMAESVIGSVLVNTDPQKAARRISQMEDPNQRRQASQNLVGSWVNQDAEAASQWVANQPTAEQGMLYQALVSHWQSWDPDSASLFVERLRDPMHQDHARVGLLTATRDAEEARGIYDEVRDPGLKQQAATYVYQRLRRSDPDEAERFKQEAGVQ